MDVSIKNRPKILIVDDKVENLVALEKILADLDVEFVRARSGNEALKKTLEHDFAIALMDVQMPGMDGFEAVELMRQEKKTINLPLIFISAVYKEEYHQIRGMETGAVDFITKPIVPKILVGKVCVFLALYDHRISLENEIQQRKQLEKDLQETNEGLEIKVEERTADLLKANKSLEEQIAHRKKMERRIEASLREKEVLLREIHHRVKNNMQVIVSMLNLQSGYIDDEQAIEAFRNSQNRIKTMALIHEKLYRSKDLARINFAEYTRDLTDYLLSAYGVAAGAIALKIDIEDISLGIDTAVPGGMLLNELITNSIKHAFADGRGGEIYIELRSDNDNLILTAGDNGAGIPEDLDYRNTESLGLQLINAFVEQLDGSVELNRKDGTEFRITFPIRKYDKRG